MLDNTPQEERFQNLNDHEQPVSLTELILAIFERSTIKNRK